MSLGYGPKNYFLSVSVPIDVNPTWVAPRRQLQTEKLVYNLRHRLRLNSKDLLDKLLKIDKRLFVTFHAYKMDLMNNLPMLKEHIAKSTDVEDVKNFQF